MPPPLPTAKQFDAMRVYGAYGATMMAVQMWEFSLIQLKLIMDPSFGRRRRVTDQRINGSIRTMIHTFQKASAKELLNNVEEHIEPELAERISKAVDTRNVLAHSYLRERVRTNLDGRMFKRGTVAELEQLARGFQKLGEDQAVVWKARLYRDPMPEPEDERETRWRAAWEQASRSIAFGSAWSEEEDESLRAMLRDTPRAS